MRHLFYTPFILMAFTATLATGQSEPQYSHYMYNRELFNPAYAGSNDAVEFNLLYRTTYVGLSERATSTIYGDVNLPVYAISSGIGLRVSDDFIGYLRTTTVNVDYNYRKKFKFGSLGIGVSAGFLQTGLQGALLRTPQGTYTDGQVDHNDPDVPAGLEKGITPDFSAGLYLNNEKYFAGVAVDHIYSISQLKNTEIDYARNLLVMGGYDFQVGKHFSIMPSTLIKSDFKEVQVDLSFTMKVYDNILTGIALRGYDARTLDAVILYAGFCVKAFRFVYSYDINTSYLSGFNTGSHEISVGYKFKMKRPSVESGFYYHNSRFL